MTDWKQLRSEYIGGTASLKQLCNTHGIRYEAAKRACAAGNWTRLRTARQGIAGVQLRIDAITDRLLDRVDQAVEELAMKDLVTKTKEKLEFGERTTEEHHPVPGGLVDVARLKTLTGVLKDIRAIRIPQSELEVREQELRLEAMEQRLSGEQGAELTVTLSPEAEAFAG